MMQVIYSFYVDEMFLSHAFDSVIEYFLTLNSNSLGMRYSSEIGGILI